MRELSPRQCVANAELRQHLDRLAVQVPACDLMKSVPETVGADVCIQQPYSMLTFRVRWEVLRIFIRNPANPAKVSSSQN